MAEKSKNEKIKGFRGWVYRTFDPIWDSKTASNIFIAFIIIIIAVPLLGIGYLATQPFAPITAKPAATSSTPLAIPSGAVVFTCSDGKVVGAVFGSSSVQLTLSDGRSITLPQTTSGEVGARYANPDGSFVFSNAGDTATVTENGATTYSNCVDEGNQ